MYPSLLIIFILRLFKSNNFPTSYLSFLLITILLPTFFFLFYFTFSLLPPSPFVLFQCYNFSSSFLMQCLCDLLLFLLLLTFLCTCLFLFPPNLIFLCFRFSMTVIQCDFLAKVQFMVLGLPDSGTPRLQDFQTPGLPNSGTPGLPGSLRAR